MMALLHSLIARQGSSEQTLAHHQVLQRFEQGLPRENFGEVGEVCHYKRKNSLTFNGLNHVRQESLSIQLASFIYCYRYVLHLIVPVAKFCQFLCSESNCFHVCADAPYAKCLAIRNILATMLKVGDTDRYPLVWCIG